MVRPNVRPPRPQSTPNAYVQTRLACGAERNTIERSLVITEARSQGTIIQLKNPPTSQYVSHAHTRTLRNGT
jgi:hypothetical protein